MEFFVHHFQVLCRNIGLVRPLDFPTELEHLVGDVTKLFHQRLDARGAQRQFLDEGRCPTAPLPEGSLRLLALAFGLTFLANDLPVPSVGLEDLLQGGQVARHPLGDDLLGKVLRRRDLHRAVEGQLASVDLGKNVDGLLSCVVALQDPPSEVHAGGLDLLGQCDFLGPGEQFDLAHLGKVHAHRVIDPPAVGFQFPAAVFLVLLGLFVLVLEGRFAASGLGFVDQFDAQFIDRHQQRIEAIGRHCLVGQILIHLFVSEIPALLALFDQGLHACMQRISHSSYSRRSTSASCVRTLYFSLTRDSKSMVSPHAPAGEKRPAGSGKSWKSPWAGPLGILVDSPERQFVVQAAFLELLGFLAVSPEENALHRSVERGLVVPAALS